MVQSTTQPCSPCPSGGIPVSSVRFVPSCDQEFVSMYVRNTSTQKWVPVNIGRRSIPTLQQVRDADRNISMNAGSYDNAHFYIRSAEGNNATTAFYTNATGGAIQAGNAKGYIALNLQPLGGLLTYGNEEVATQAWVRSHPPTLQQVASAGNSYDGDLLLGTSGNEVYVGSGPAGKGAGNTRLGTGTLIAMVSANWNTAIGSYALASMQYGLNNVAIGEVAMVDFVGVPNTYSNNTAVGDSAGLGMTQGTRNAFFGASAGLIGHGPRPGGDMNTYIGNAAGNAGDISSGTTALGSGNIFLGHLAGGGIVDPFLSYQLRIGTITNYNTDKHIITGSMVQGAQALTFNASVNIASLAGTGSRIAIVDSLGNLSATAAVPVTNGGTGATSLTGVAIGNGTTAMTAITGTANQLMRRNAANTAYEFFTPGYLTSVPTLQNVATAGNTFSNGIALNGSDVGALSGVALTVNKNHGVHMAIGGAGWQSSTLIQTGYDTLDYLTLRAPSYGNWNTTNWLKLYANGQALLPEGRIATREWVQGLGYSITPSLQDVTNVSPVRNVNADGESWSGNGGSYFVLGRAGGHYTHLYSTGAGLGLQSHNGLGAYGGELSMQPNGGILTYGGNEVATKSWTNTLGNIKYGGVHYNNISAASLTGSEHGFLNGTNGLFRPDSAGGFISAGNYNNLPLLQIYGTYYEAGLTDGSGFYFRNKNANATTAEDGWLPWYQVATTNWVKSNGIQNQFASAQSASAWISGNMRAAQFVGGNSSFAISDVGGYWGLYSNTALNNVATAKVGALAISNNYSVNPPVNGIYVRGAIQLDKETSAITGSVGGAISFYNSTFKPWQIYMGRATDTNSGAYGNITPQIGSDVTTWALRSYVENLPGYGWVWESGHGAQTEPGIAAELSSNTGNFRVAGQLRSGSLSAGGNVSLFADNNGIIRGSNITPATTVGQTVLSGSGWVSIAYNGDGANSGNRASGKFTIVENASGRHITLSFYASYHYGTGWNIVLENGSQYAGSPIISAIRILGNSVYTGAELQVYLLNPPVSLSVIVDENYQKSGWTLVTPTFTQVVPGLSEKAKIELTSLGSAGGGLVYSVNSYTGFSAETDWFYSKQTGKGWWNVAHNAGIYAVTNNEVRTLNNSHFRVGDAGGGYVRMEHGDVSNAGFFAVHNADGSRNGYVGYNSNMMNYAAERGLHQFTGNGTNTIMSLLPSSTAQTELLTIGSASAGNYCMTLYNNTASQNIFTAANANAYVTGTAAGDSGVRFKNTYVWGPSNGGNAYMYLNTSGLKVDVPIIPFTTPAAYTGSWQVMVKDTVTSQMKTIDSSWLSSNNIWNYSGPTGQWIEPINAPAGYSGITTKGFASSGKVEQSSFRFITEEDKTVIFYQNADVELPDPNFYPGRELRLRVKKYNILRFSRPVFDFDISSFTEFPFFDPNLSGWYMGSNMQGFTLDIQAIRRDDNAPYEWFITAITE